MRKDKSQVSISKVDTLTWLRVKANVNLKHDIVEDIQASAPKETVPAFDWDDNCTERAQSVRLTLGYTFSAVGLFGGAWYTFVAKNAQCRAT